MVRTCKVCGESIGPGRPLYQFAKTCKACGESNERGRPYSVLIGNKITSIKRCQVAPAHRPACKRWQVFLWEGKH